MKRIRKWLGRELVPTGRGNRRNQQETMTPNEPETQEQIADRECQETEEQTGGEQTLAVRRPDNQDQIIVFQQMLQTQHQVSGSGNIPINNPTDCTINIYQSKDSARTSHQPGQLSGDMSENQPSISQQPTTQGAVSNPLTPECSTSDVRSQAAAAKCKDALKLHYRTAGSYVQLNPWCDEHKKHIKDIYTRLQLANAKGNRRGTLVSYEDILVLKTREGDLIPIAVFGGLAGRGKSTLYDKIAYDWAVDCSQALQKYELVFLLKMSYLEQASDLIDAVFDQLIAENIAKHIEKGDLQSYIEKDSDKVLILLDGFDELETTSLSESSFGSILKLLSRKSYRGCTVLVSTRPSHLHRLITNELVQEPFTHVRVLGFDKDSIEEYVQRYYSDEPDKAKGLLERIGSSDNLSTLAESPMLLLLMCLLWREDSTLPETMSRLYQNAIEYIAKRKKVSEEEMSRVVIALGKVGLRGLLSPQQELTFKESDFERNVFDVALKVGILTRQRVCKRLKPYNSVQFIHKTFQEFCAAAYLQILFQANTEEFHSSVNEIMSKDPSGFEYLLRFCCGDNEACTLEILKVFRVKRRMGLSRECHLALHCYFEGQCKCLPPETFMSSILTKFIEIDHLNNDSENSLRYFVQRVAQVTKDSGNVYLAKVKSVSLKSRGFLIVSESLCDLPNLDTLCVSYNDLGGTAASWCNQLGQCKALQDLTLVGCSLNGQDMVHVAESLRGLPNLVTLALPENDLSGTAASWCKQLGQYKALQRLDLSWCKLNARAVVRVAKSLGVLPNLVEWDLSFNDLGGTAALWSKQVGQCKPLCCLEMSDCSLNGQDMVCVARSVSGLPNLVTLDLSHNDLGGLARSFCAEIKKFKVLRKLILHEKPEELSDNDPCAFLIFKPRFNRRRMDYDNQRFAAH
ncbi:NLR family CARD domain-containing protein 4-like isoform X2 [Acanthaster planci]|uniref:NLR family CARD domain-containing protein 4-like isoform X2 n=1 Tax=Acanthaster planci TaxID=133434 RepID=A0A8B7YNJ3_ACAPL|nr:NLR family CARD domain-containing protein 4-like isoform X2 [Acanthaster planci]